MGNAIIVGGDSADATYLNTVRSTITAVDNQRLSAIYFGIFLPSTIDVGAIHFIDVEPATPLNSVAACILAFASMLLCLVFASYVSKFSFFVTEGVNIALHLEEQLSIDKNYRITDAYQRHWAAGKRGGLITSFFYIALGALVLFSISILTYASGYLHVCR